MKRRTFLGALLACGTLGLIHTATALAEEKDQAAPSGVWMLKGGEMKIEFAKDTLRISPHNKDEFVLIVCKFTVDKDGQIRAKVTELDGKEKDKVKELVPVGLEFSFTWKAKGDSATLANVKGENVDVFKNHMEGDYEKK